ncbi:MAG: hypothetical protein GY874_11500 [Desulfobacteraceae bacterium]|nr:hypothetical protein [Desulfobacteraceae bacterium]
MIADSYGSDLDINHHLDFPSANLVRDSEDESENENETDSENEDEPDIEQTSKNQDSDEKPEPVQTVPSRLLGELRKLDVSYNPEAKAQLLSLNETAN